MFLKFSIVPFLLVSFLTLPRILTQSYIFLAIPTLIKSLNLTKIESQFIIPSMLLGTIIFLIPAGKFGDRFGPKKNVDYFKLGVCVCLIYCGLLHLGHSLINFAFFSWCNSSFQYDSRFDLCVGHLSF